MDHPSTGPDPSRPGTGPASAGAPPPLDDDEDVVDAEIVETSDLPAGLGSAGTGGPVPADAIAPDYSDAGVPSLDYVRNKIEGRFGTAVGSVELAEAAAAREAALRAEREQRQAATAEQQRAAREQAAKDKLEEIRRSIRPGG